MPISYSEVISDKISTLMNTTLLNNHTKFGAKIFKPYRIITFLVLGHFFSRTLIVPIRLYGTAGSGKV